ncbi:MAG TPA: hypothetical protein VIF15_13200, partial [Polyangiaceae bacterium]
RKLARGEIAGVRSALRSTTDALRPGLASSAASAASAASSPSASPSAPASEPAAGPYATTQLPEAPPVVVEREREYPREGADSYGALPDTAIVYDDALPASPLADDPLYASGSPS